MLTWCVAPTAAWQGEELLREGGHTHLLGNRAHEYGEGPQAARGGLQGLAHLVQHWALELQGRGQGPAGTGTAKRVCGWLWELTADARAFGWCNGWRVRDCASPHLVPDRGALQGAEHALHADP